jgi:hypothetical protein
LPKKTNADYRRFARWCLDPRARSRIHTSTETVENPVEDPLNPLLNSLREWQFQRFALCDSTVTRARDLRDGSS